METFYFTHKESTAEITIDAENERDAWEQLQELVISLNEWEIEEYE